MEPSLAPVASHGSFAYADSSGTQLLVLDSLPDPSTIRGAICSGGVALRVRYDRRQPRHPKDNGRQIASNFRHAQGDVFRVTQRRAPLDKVCYLSPDTVLLAGAQTATMHDPTDCLPAQLSRLATEKGRQVIHCWNIAAAPLDLAVLVVQFATIDSSAVGSIVVIGDSSLMFKDFPAVYRGPGESTWRVDDGGVFSPSAFDILFVAALPHGYVMAIAWGEPRVSHPSSCLRSLLVPFEHWPRVIAIGLPRRSAKGWLFCSTIPRRPP